MLIQRSMGLEWNQIQQLQTETAWGRNEVKYDVTCLIIQSSAWTSLYIHVCLHSRWLKWSGVQLMYWL